MIARAFTTLVAAGVLVSAPAAVAPSTFSVAPRTVQRSPSPAPEVTAVRVGHHPAYDRVVLQLAGNAAGYRVRYVHRLHRDPSGRRVDLLGPASLKIVLEPANGHDPETGQRTLTTPRRTKWRLDQVRETAVIGDFEAVFTLGVGLEHEAPFRVRTLHHPTRIVVDIRH
jgi:hypothetical protein